MKIKNVKHKAARDGRINGFCGPAALASILGITAETAAKRLLKYAERTAQLRWGKRQTNRLGYRASTKKNAAHGIAGVDSAWMLATLADAGIDYGRNQRLQFSMVVNGKTQTLAQWDKCRKPAERMKLYLIGLTSHYIVVQGDKLVDNHFNTGTALSESKWLRNRVDEVYEINKAA